MSHHEAETVCAQPKRRGRCGVRLTAAPAAVALLGLALMVVSCTSVLDRGTSSGDTSVTVIATASPTPTATPVAFVPLTAPDMPGYRLVFSDEFVGPKLNSKRWATALPWGSTTLREDQHYTPDAITQNGGVLTITASKQASPDKPYASGVVSSLDRFSFSYGYAEARMQVPAGAGLWSAFWLLSPLAKSHDEIDIVEVIGSDPRKAYTVLHYGTTAIDGKSLGVYQGPDLSAGFHTFAVDWEPEHIVWYVDGVERYRVSENVPSAPMIVIANLAVGGKNSWSGPPDRYTEFPAQLKIDYIRVFQRN